MPVRLLLAVLWRAEPDLLCACLLHDKQRILSEIQDGLFRMVERLFRMNGPSRKCNLSAMCSLSVMSRHRKHVFHPRRNLVGEGDCVTPFDMIISFVQYSEE